VFQSHHRFDLRLAVTCCCKNMPVQAHGVLTRGGRSGAALDA
jgi:hypothetical protein